MTEKEKMLNGMIYDSMDKELYEIRLKAHRLCQDFNNLRDDDARRAEIIHELIPDHNGVCLQGPIQFDYGCFTKFGKDCYANFNLLVLDSAPIVMGDNVIMGCNVSLVTPVHPMLGEERRLHLNKEGKLTDWEYAKPITIGNDVWIASNVVICGGVTIGDDVVIGAGSVVSRDIPSHTFAAGNPCRVIRKLTKEDSILLKKELWER